ncbi:MAG: hypothetical protein A2W23_09470, partial [Planctomycetes bacterium RBG_16_43_13]
VPVFVAYPQQGKKSTNATSKITDVVVYPDRARVTRTASVGLDGGVTDVVFKDLPATLIENSIRAEASAGTKVVGIELKRAYSAETKDADIKQLEEKIQAVNDKKLVLNDQQNIIQNTEQFLTSLRSQYDEKVSKELLGTKLDVDGIAKLIEITEKTLSDSAAKRRSIGVSQRELQKELNVLQQQLNEIYRSRSAETKMVTVTIDSKQGAEVSVKVSYVIWNAYWHPLYDARTSLNSKSLELIYYGVVTQNTGEDWKDVNLTLSTAQPSLSGQPAELTARFVDFYSDTANNAPAEGGNKIIISSEKYKRTSEETKSRIADEEDRIELASRGADLPTPLYETASVEEKATSVFFNVKKQETILSNNQPHKTIIGVDSFKPNFEYEAVPVSSPHGYLKASMANNDKPRLAGELNIFTDDDFVGASRLKTVAPTQPFSAYLGVDESVRCTRKEVKQERGSTGGFFSSGKERQTHAYSIKLANFKKETIKLTVSEPAPLTRHEDIEIKIVNTSSVECKRTEEGFLKWVVELKPGEEKELTYDIEILYPKDKAIYFGTLMQEEFNRVQQKMSDLNQDARQLENRK